MPLILCKSGVHFSVRDVEFDVLFRYDPALNKIRCFIEASDEVRFWQIKEGQRSLKAPIGPRYKT